MSPLATDPVLAQLVIEAEVTRFLHREARILDERRFDDWLALMDFDITYVSPLRVSREGGDDITGPDDLHIFDDDYGQLELRVQSLQVRSAWAEIPPSRTRRLITNITVDPREDGTYEVHSNFLLYRTRGETIEHRFVGCRSDVLKRVAADDFRICHRTVIFDTVAFETDNISVLF